MSTVNLSGNKTITINDNKTTSITNITENLVLASFVATGATPSSFPAVEVVADSQIVYSPGSPVKSGFVFNG